MQAYMTHQVYAVSKYSFLRWHAWHTPYRSTSYIGPHFRLRVQVACIPSFSSAELCYTACTLSLRTVVNCTADCVSRVHSSLQIKFVSTVQFLFGSVCHRVSDDVNSGTKNIGLLSNLSCFCIWSFLLPRTVAVYQQQNRDCCGKSCLGKSWLLRMTFY